MFEIEANPTIDASLTIKGQGREQKLELTFRHKTRTEYLALVQSVKDEKSMADAVLAIVEKWNANAPLNAESLKKLEENQPGASWAIINGYWDALTVAREGN